MDGVSLHIGAGEMVGLVGESGCGKTMLGMSILRLVPEPGRIVAGTISFEGHDVLAMDDDALQRLRGAGVAMSFQNAMTALNPLTRVGSQVREAMAAHDRFSPEEATGRVVSLLAGVRIPAADRRARDYPHQFSGGMRQRVLIAMGVSNQPQLLIADEPTTALDVTTQAQIVDLLRGLNRDLGTSMLLITHNVALVAGLCRRVVVMYAGRVVEQGPVDEVFERPQHPYTWALLRSVPRVSHGGRGRLLSIPGAPPDLGDLPTGCTFQPRCRFAEERCVQEEPPLSTIAAGRQARCWVLMRTVPEPAVDSEEMAAVPAAIPPPGGQTILSLDAVHKHYPAAGRGEVRAVDGVSLEVRQGETLGLIGESGCGKSTLARVIAQLVPATSGTVVFEGQDLGRLSGRALRGVRRRLQMVFQDPFASLDPRMTVGGIVAEPLANFGVRGSARRARVAELLDLVQLTPQAARRYPHEFSGGQRQRIGIARALALNPSLLVCDEPVSALDVSIQAQIINLFADLQRDLGLTYVFIAHDLAVIGHLADRVAVMYLGKVVELGQVADVYRRPQHPYTKALVDAIPVPDSSIERARRPPLLRGEVPSGMDPPVGCRFHPRCPIARVPGLCHDDEPQLSPHGQPGQRAACHFAGQA